MFQLQKRTLRKRTKIENKALIHLQKLKFPQAAAIAAAVSRDSSLQGSLEDGAPKKAKLRTEVSPDGDDRCRQYRMPKTLKLATRLTENIGKKNKNRRVELQNAQPSDVRVQKLRKLQTMHTFSI